MKGEAVSRNRGTAELVQKSEDNIPRRVIHVERNLEAIGYFSATKGCVRERDGSHQKKFLRKVVPLPLFEQDGKPVERSYEILPDHHLGHPDTADLDYYRAVQLIVDETTRRQDGEPPATVEFLPGALLGIMAHLRGDKTYTRGKETYEQIEKFVRKLRRVGIISRFAIYDKGKQRWAELETSVCDVICCIGETHPVSGNRATKHYLHFSSWYLSSLKSHYVKPFDPELYFSLCNAIAKHLYGIFDVMLYAGEGRAHKNYQDLCNVIGIIPQQYPAKITRQLGLALAELKAAEYLEEYKMPVALDDSVEIVAGRRFWEVPALQQFKQLHLFRGEEGQRARKLFIPPQYLPKREGRPSASADAVELAKYFHLKKRSDAEPNLLDKELEYAEHLISAYGKDDARVMVEQGVEEMKKTKFNAATFMGLKQYEKKIAGKLKKEQAEKKKQEESERKWAAKIQSVIEPIEKDPEFATILQAFWRRQLPGLGENSPEYNGIYFRAMAKIHSEFGVEARELPASVRDRLVNAYIVIAVKERKRAQVSGTSA